jgi:hypothetical protein
MAGKPLHLWMSLKSNRPKRPLGAAIGLLVVLLVAGLVPALSQPARAEQRYLTLYVDTTHGWSLAAGGEGRPGPILIAVLGDQIDVTMTSEDLLAHGFFIDYDGNGVPSSGDFESPQTMGTITFSIPANTEGTFTYGDQVVPLNTGTWITNVNSPPTAALHAPTATTSWTGGVSHDISFDVSDADSDPVTATVTYSYGGGASQTIQTFTAGANPNVVPWTPTGFSATDVVVRVTVQDTHGASSHVDSSPFEVDSTAPTIASFTPANGASQVDRNSLIQVNWSEAMNKATTEGAFGVRGAGGPWLAGTITWSTDAKQMTFHPGGTLGVGTVYEVHANATATDHSDPGNAFGGSIWSFSTGTLTDKTPPRILSMSANPSVQIASGFVNLTADVTDNLGIATVSAAIQGLGTAQNLTLTHASGTRWYLNRTYGAVGHYNITVWATDMSGNVASQKTGIDITPEGTANLAAPAAVTATVTDGQVDVTWSPVASPNLAGYHVYRGNRSSPDSFVRLTETPVSPTAPTQYRDTTAQSGQTYYYTVTSVNTTGAESVYGPVYSVTIPQYQTPPLFDPVPWAVAGVTLGVILGALYGMVWRRRPA